MQNPAPAMRNYFVYIMASESGVLYTGVTNSLERRVWQHKQKASKGFTAKYRVSKLVYYEWFNDIRDAIAREKRIKGWLRAKKITIIEAENPFWVDLSDGWYDNDGRDSSVAAATSE